MAKSKNHTAHNQNRKAHRNGIIKPKVNYYSSTKGMDPKFLRNQRFAKKKAPKTITQRKVAQNRAKMALRHKEVIRKKFLAKKTAETAKKVAELKEKQKQRKEKKLQQPPTLKKKKNPKLKNQRKKNSKLKNPKLNQQNTLKEKDTIDLN
jgi:large subunit ribosomal protein L29e